MRVFICDLCGTHVQSNHRGLVHLSLPSEVREFCSENCFWVWASGRRGTSTGSTGWCSRPDTGTLEEAVE